jgi:hypothetical protein
MLAFFAAYELLNRLFGFELGEWISYGIVIAILFVAAFAAARDVGSVRIGAKTGAGIAFIYTLISIAWVAVFSPGLLSDFVEIFEGKPSWLMVLFAVAMLVTAAALAAFGALVGAVGGWAALRTRPPAAQGATTQINPAQLQKGQRVRIGYRDKSSHSGVRGQVLRVGPNEVIVHSDKSGREVYVPFNNIAVVEALEA